MNNFRYVESDVPMGASDQIDPIGHCPHRTKAQRGVRVLEVTCTLKVHKVMNMDKRMF